MRQVRQKIFFVSLLLTFFYFTIKAQLHYLDQKPYADTSELFQLSDRSWAIQDSLWNEGWAITKMEIFELGVKKYLLLDGRFDVYEWSGSGWINLYKGVHHGYNYFSKKIVFKDEIYSFGGYGFWRTHGDLIKFDKYNHEWEIHPYKDYEISGTGFAYNVDSILFVLDPFVLKDGYTNSVYNLNSFKINLISKKTDRFNAPHLYSIQKKVPNNKIQLETENYILLDSKPFFVIKKADQSFYEFPLSIFRGVSFANTNLYYTFHIKSDSLIIYNKDHIAEWNYNVKTKLLDFEPMKQESNLFLYILGISFLCVIFYLLWRIRLKKNKFNKKNHLLDFEFKHDQIKKIMEKSGETLTVQEIDKILNLENIIPAETKRYKRSILINGVNLEMRSKVNQKLIERIKDPSDKRHFLYEVKDLRMYFKTE
mgnify:CR=1 FL=1|jgi:hypothetical protein